MTMFRKDHIVTDMNGREIARRRVIATAGKLQDAYRVVANELMRLHPAGSNTYHFCDVSEGTEIAPLNATKQFQRIA